VVSRSIDDIRSALVDLANRWVTYEGTERSASQTFLNQLIAAYTGSDDVMGAGARFEEFGVRDEGSGFMDLYWRDVVIVEMKAPSQSRRLDQHRAQALDYWRNSANSEKGIAAPPFLVLCSIRQFEIWEPGKYPTTPVDSFSLAELPTRAESLLFLAGRKPLFGGPGAAVTEQAAEHMVKLYFSLLERKAVEPKELRRFVIQTIWTLFAEDIGILEGKPLETLVRALLADTTRSSAVELTDLYRRFNTKDDERRNRGRSQSVPFVNGDLFAEASEVHLEANEMEHLLQASRFDWQHVNPTVFGSLLEGCLGRNHRWELGAHYTSEADIMTIVEPVIVRPWVNRIEATKSLKEANALHDELCKFKVLDPAMGCSNFLSIAYRELRILELRLHDRMDEHARKEGNQPTRMDGQWFPINNIQGIEIDPFAVDIAKTTLWMTHALESRRHGLAEPVLPLPSLTSLICADSLKIEWPETDVVIGNPPFHGDRNLRKVVGDEYIDWLKQEFGVGVKDHCVYFFIKTHRNLKPGQRAGLVATNTISQTKNRDASLVWIAQNDGVITDAISSKNWSGEAAVDVSIVCWQINPVNQEHVFLDGKKVSGITPSLTEGSSHKEALKLMGNKGRCFQGFLTRGMGFVISTDEASTLIARGGNSYKEVVVPFLNGDDTVRNEKQEPTRWVIDFADFPLEVATSKYPIALAILRERVLPEREHDPAQMKRWWQFWNNRMGLRKALSSFERFAVASRVGKRLLLVWADPTWRPSDACNVFGFDDDYNFGLCSSKIHEIWARGVSSTLEDRLRYTPSIAFETFPFPQPTDIQRERIGAAAKLIVELRRPACDSISAGLTKVYNLMDDGGFVELKRAHRELDLAVADAYGWDAAMLDDPVRLLDALFDLNAQCATDPNYAPFGKTDDVPTLLDLSEED
jgi:hypothetical protein